MKTSISSLLRVAVKSAFAVSLAVGAPSAQAVEFPTNQKVLFYTNFADKPEGDWAAYGANTSNKVMFTLAGDQTETIGGITFGALDGGSCKFYHMGKDSPAGAATADDAGATKKQVQNNTGKGYVMIPEVQGPCECTVWVYNATPKTDLPLDVYAVTANGETLVANLNCGSSKNTFKRSFKYEGTDVVRLKFASPLAKLGIYDILVLAPVDESAEPVPFGVTDEALLSQNVSYEDGALSLPFSKKVVLAGTPVIGGADKFEEINVTAAGSAISVSYAALQPNHVYTVTFPAGCVTSEDGSESFEGTLTFSTSDFSDDVADGATHYGKAFATLPVSFKPFDSYAGIESFNPEFAQSKANDYPHWVQVSGEVTADHAVITKTADKVMGYFAPESKLLYLDLAYEGDGDFEVKVQEARNPDAAPRWATVRVLRKADLPFKGNLALNPASRFVKVSAPTLTSGEISVNNLAISDDKGDFGTTTAIEDVIGATVVSTEVYTVAGVRLAAPAEGLNIVRTVYANGAVKVSKVVR